MNNFLQTYADTRGQFLNQTWIVLQLAQGADSQPDYLQSITRYHCFAWPDQVC